MWHSFLATTHEILGLGVEPGHLTLGQMMARTAVVFPLSVLLVRFGCRRLLGGNSGMDVMLVVLLGSVLSRAINGQADFLATLGASAGLVALHRLLALAAFRFHAISVATKGSALVLVRAGRIDRAAQSQADITDDDLMEGIRLHGRVADMSRVAEARLERSGEISVVLRDEGHVRRGRSSRIRPQRNE